MPATARLPSGPRSHDHSGRAAVSVSFSRPRRFFQGPPWYRRLFVYTSPFCALMTGFAFRRGLDLSRIVPERDVARAISHAGWRR